MKHLIASLALLFTLPTLASDRHEGFYLGVELSGASLEISPDVENESYSDDMAGSLSLRAGYKWSNNWIAELRGSHTSSYNLLGAFDDMSLSQTQYLFGHSFRIGEQLNFVPMIGWSDWKLKSTEGRLFNPGKEESSLVDENGNIFLRVGLDYSVSETVGLSTYYTTTDFGTVEATDIAIGVNMKFQ